MYSKADKVLDFILNNATKLSPEKIAALSKVVEAVKDINEAAHEPNTIPSVESHEELMEEEPVDLAEVQGFQVNDGPVMKTRIFKS